MSYINDKEFEVLGKVWTQLRDNNGHVSEDVFLEFSDLMHSFGEYRQKQIEKSIARMNKARSEDKEYGCRKNKFIRAYRWTYGSTAKKAREMYEKYKTESPDQIDIVIEYYEDGMKEI